MNPSDVMALSGGAPSSCTMIGMANAPSCVSDGVHSKRPESALKLAPSGNAVLEKCSAPASGSLALAVKEIGKPG